MLVMVMIKAFQQKVGVLLFWPEMRHKGEVMLKEQRTKVRTVTRTFTKRNLYIILHFILTKIRNIFARVQRKLDEKSHHLVSQIRGRQHLEGDKVRPSNFLHDMKRFKDRFRR